MGAWVQKIVAFVCLVVAFGCQQNPFPEYGMLTSKPLTAPVIDRSEWKRTKHVCIEKGIPLSIALPVRSTDRYALETRVEIITDEPSMTDRVTWKKGVLQIHALPSDSADLHYFTVKATSLRDRFPSSEKEEMFAYEIAESSCEGDRK